MTGSFFKAKLFAIVAAALFLVGGAGSASAELRTLSLYFPHTKESLTVTYKKDGRYIPDAMRQLNWFFRDWRRNVAIKMDPRTIDLLWELYTDLGAKKPAHIVSGYRSPATNGMLRRIGRKVARHSQHMRGKAIDVYFPDVPISRMRGSALARRVGGVGYYPRSGKYGFIHIDSGSVRHWPRMSPTRLASVISRYRSTIGARYHRRNIATTRYAAASGGPRNIIPAKLRTRTAVQRKVAVPLPRPRPLAVAMAAAAADTFIVPVSAPGGKQNFGPNPSLTSGGINSLLAAHDLSGNASGQVQRTNRAAKSSFAGAIRSGTARNVPLLRPMQAASGSGGFWWSGDMNGLIRRDGAPNAFSNGENGVVIASRDKLSSSDKSALDTMIAALTGKREVIVNTTHVARSGKSDSLRVNRAAKGDLLIWRKTSAVQAGRSSERLAGNFKAILRSADKPVGFGQ